MKSQRWYPNGVCRLSSPKTNDTKRKMKKFHRFLLSWGFYRIWRLWGAYLMVWDGILMIWDGLDIFLFLIFGKSGATPPKTNDTMKRHDKKEKNESTTYKATFKQL